MKIGGLVLALAAVAALLTGCGGTGDQAEAARGAEHAKAAKQRRPEPREVWVTTEGWEGPGDVGLLIAEQKGYFKDVGISVWIGAPRSPGRVMSYVAGGTDFFGVAQQPQVAIAREKGAPIVAVGGLVQEPTAALIWLKKSHIGGIADLKGKTIAIPGVPFQEALLESVLRQNGLTLDDVKVRHVGYELVPALLRGKADAIFGGSWSLEGVDLESRGAKPVIKRVQELGVPAYEELVLITRTDLADEYPRLIRKFMSAVARGTAVALRHPAAAVKAVQETDEANPELSRRTTAAAVRATLPLLSRTGYMNPGKASDLIGWMHEHGLIQRELPVSELLTNDHLPQP